MKQTGVYLTLKVVTTNILSNEDMERLQGNIWSLLNEVRPDLVEQNLSVGVKHVEVEESEL